MITTIRHLDTKPCPDCEGTGHGDRIVFYTARDHSGAMSVCHKCRGFKTVPSEIVDNSHIVLAMKVLGLSMRQMAKLWNCGIADVSKVRQNAAVVEHRLVEGGETMDEIAERFPDTASFLEGIGK